MCNPVPHFRRGGGGGLQGLRAGQASTAADVEQRVDIPVALGRREGGGGLQGFLPVQGSTVSLSRRLLPNELIKWLRNGESGELADEPGGGGVESIGVTGGAEAAVVVLSSLASGMRGSACSLEFHSCIALVSGPAMGWGRQAAAVYFCQGRSSSHR